jgi:hypothetical protein
MSAIQQMLLAGGLSASLTGHTVTDSAVGSAVLSSFGLANTGLATFATLNSGSGNYSPEWNPAGFPAASFEGRWTNTSGTPTSGDLTATWLGLGTTRGWTVSRGTVGTTACTGTVEIRDASTLAVLASASITITCTES